MEPERWQRIQTILDAAAGHSASRQDVILKEACDGDASLYDDVRVFHRLEREVEDFIEDPLWKLHRPEPVVAPPSSHPLNDRRIGPYRLERVLGRGGMGTVFLASREDDYQQQVAVKLLNWDIGQDEALARFYNERQILASLQHPQIARLLDGGTTEEGMPYLVMEYVEGERIDSYCLEQDLSIRQRLELFMKVCAAVHFAHQNLVVHRDLKASNILVTRDRQPRLLDFGIAKLLQPELAPRSVATAPGRGPMTPAYASPEQVLNQPITTVCDVYALGVLLYRLLTGHPPYVLEGRSYTEMVELIAHADPKRPSQTLREPPEPPTVAEPLTTAQRTAALGAFEARRLERRLSGDLDSIVLKAMRKEPRHRYGSAAELADDIRRHLTGLPVTARKGTWSYHAGKFLRRHKPALAALLLILGFAVTATVLWRQAVEDRRIADEARTDAERQQSRARAVTEFLEGLFRAADPDAGGEGLTVRDLLDQGRESILTELDQEPETRAEILGTLGTVFRNLGLLATAAELKEMAVEVRRASDPSDRPDLAKDLNGLASVLYAAGDYAGAEKHFREALAMRQALGQSSGDVENTLFNLGSTLMHLGKGREAEPLLREALAIRLEVFGPEDPKVASCYYSLGALERDRGNYASAEIHLRQALEIREATLGVKNTKVAQVLGSLGLLLHLKGDLEPARDAYARALDIGLDLLGESHVDVARTRKKLASLLVDLGELEPARAMIDQALAALREDDPSHRWERADVESVRGALWAAQGRYAEAEAQLLASFETLRELRGEQDPATQRVAARLVGLYEAWNRPADAERFSVHDGAVEQEPA